MLTVISIAQVALRERQQNKENKIKTFIMKKLSLKPNVINKGEILTRTQLKKVMGGNGSGTGSGNCFLRCDQNSSSGTSVSDCSRATAEAGCGADLSNTVCVCTP